MASRQAARPFPLSFSLFPAAKPLLRLVNYCDTCLLCASLSLCATLPARVEIQQLLADSTFPLRCFCLPIVVRHVVVAGAPVGPLTMDGGCDVGREREIVTGP